MIGAISAIWPKRWTGRIARVRAVMRSSIRAGSMLKVDRVDVHEDGRGSDPCEMAPAVAKKEKGVVTTSSPGPMSSAMSATTSASVPDDTPIPWALSHVVRDRLLARPHDRAQDTKRCEVTTRSMRRIDLGLDRGVLRGEVQQGYLHGIRKLHATVADGETRDQTPGAAGPPPARSIAA